MKVGFGKHAEVDVRQLLLKHPDYVMWVLDQDEPKGALAALVPKLREYIRRFDAQPFTKSCHGTVAGQKCTHAVTCGTAYHSHSGLSVDLVWWCDECDPHQLGAIATLIRVRTYRDALEVVANYGGRKSDYAGIIKDLATGKGMPARVTTKALDEFFGS